MGRGSSKVEFTEQELEEYEQLTFLTRREILYCFTRFKKLAPKKISENRNARIDIETLKNFPELKYNPFKDRIFKIFSSTRDGNCNFEDFLDMMSVLSHNAPLAVKAEYAFRIFDFDGDDFIGPDDMKNLITRLVGDSDFQEEQIMGLIKKMGNQSDLDDDGMVSYPEFEHIVAKSRDFEKVFQIHLF